MKEVHQTLFSTMVTTFLDSGGDPKSTFDTVLQSARYTTRGELKDASSGFRALPLLVAAARVGDAVIVQRLLDANVHANLRHNGLSALMASAYGGCIEVATLLLKKGANPLLRTRSGSTASLIAAYRGHHELLELLSTYINVHQEVVIAKRQEHVTPAPDIKPDLKLPPIHLAPTIRAPSGLFVGRAAWRTKVGAESQKDMQQIDLKNMPLKDAKPAYK